MGKPPKTQKITGGEFYLNLYFFWNFKSSRFAEKNIFEKKTRRARNT